MDASVEVRTESFRRLRDRAADLIALLRSHGIPVNPACRLARYMVVLDAASSADGLTVPQRFDLATWHRSLMEVDDLDLAARTLGMTPEVNGWRQAISRSLKGSALRRDERNHSSARDIQFEIVVASLFRRAGYAVALAEPDVVLTSENPPIGIAAKRPRSMRKLESAIKEADRQIARSRQQGVIAIDLSVVLNPPDGHITTTASDHAFDAVIHAANHFLDRNAKRLRSLLDTRRTFGIIAQLTMPVFDSATPQLSYVRRYAVMNLCALSDPRAATLRTIADRLRVAQHDPG